MHVCYVPEKQDGVQGNPVLASVLLERQHSGGTPEWHPFEPGVVVKQRRRPLLKERPHGRLFGAA